MLQVETKSLHKGVKDTRHTFLPVPSGVDKIEMLAQVCSQGKAAQTLENILQMGLHLPCQIALY